MAVNLPCIAFYPLPSAKEGYIGLQDHGNDVWFRNIRIRQL
ncbi:MAG: DUF1080 domain-containing protein [Bacteroidales bacterium]|nr:DUF1080 domain-containing protein [Bacteroidales bacterium]